MALEEKDYATAAKEKLDLEEEQRRQRRIREVKGEEWPIKYFTVCYKWCDVLICQKTNFPEYPDQDWYEYNGGYWEQREERKKKAEEEMSGFVFEER